MKKIIYIGIIATCLMFVGCSTEPTYYSDREVGEYVQDIFGTEYKLKNKLAYPDDTDEENVMYEYEYTNGEQEFSVFSSTIHTSFISGETIFYEENIYDNFIQSEIKRKESEIAKLFEKSGFEYSIYDEGYYNIGLTIYLEDYTDIESAAKTIASLDNLMNLKYDYLNWKDGTVQSMFEVEIKIKPNGIYSGENWKEDYSTNVSTIRLSNSGEGRRDPAGIVESIERALIDKADSSYEEIYVLPDEFIGKHLPKTLDLVSINGEAINLINEEENEEYFYEFKYDTSRDFYYIDNLDPSQNFEGSYNYFDTGSFQNLVEQLGGEYVITGDWESMWKIGEDVWQGVLIVDKDSYFQDFILYKNGELVSLSENLEDDGNGTVSGRQFTMEDLEKMLGADLIMNTEMKTVDMIKE